MMKNNIIGPLAAMETGTISFNVFIALVQILYFLENIYVNANDPWPI
ncbi:MAG: hypothetical protein KJN59_05020 [Bacteroidia bacterium]|nr:hypothetical protein [Bacteroidia bacterium]